MRGLQTPPRQLSKQGHDDCSGLKKHPSFAYGSSLAKQSVTDALTEVDAYCLRLFNAVSQQVQSTLLEIAADLQPLLCESPRGGFPRFPHAHDDPGAGGWSSVMRSTNTLRPRSPCVPTATYDQIHFHACPPPYARTHVEIDLQVYKLRFLMEPWHRGRGICNEEEGCSVR